MTANKRIFLNVVATYGRSVYSIIIGLIAGRWTLMSLGHVDYGLMGLVGGLIGFVTFLNSLMASAVGRYYAFAVGQARTNELIGIDECRKWFNTALLIHTILPIVLVVAGYPVGSWAIENFLTIPVDRVHACIWVWRFSCLSCFISMINVPFQAMYSAKQEIAEMTIYSVIATTINFLFLTYMITHPGIWLMRYAAWMCFIASLPRIIIVVRAILVYKECRFIPKYLLSWQRSKELFLFAGGRFICALSQMIRAQGWAILVNKYLGPIKNASMAVGTTLSTHATSLTGAMSGAYFPAITNACGEGNYGLMRSLCFQMCKFGTLSVVVFAVPLIIEADNVLTLWLNTPPEGAALLCSCLLIDHCISRMVDGHWMGVFAVGKMAGFNTTESIGYFLAFAVSWFFIICGIDVASVGLSAIVCSIYTIVVKLYYGRKHCQLPIKDWIKKVAIPLSVISCVSFLIGSFVSSQMNPTLMRVFVTTVISEIVILSLSWFVLCTESEKIYIVSRISKMFFKRRTVLG